MFSISKNVYIDNLDYIMNADNNTYHRTNEMKPADVKSSTYFDFGMKNNEKDSKFKVGDHVKISNYKNIFAERCVLNWSKEVSVIKKVKNTVPWTYFIVILTRKKLFE